MKYSLKRACLRHLNDTFGVADYRPGQKEAVQALLSGRDVMCILPTGAGKSLCWQLPSVMHEGLTVVISPLIALMRDQVQHLKSIGIPAVSLDSLLSADEKDAAIDSIRQGIIRIVFVSPERLRHTRFCQLCIEMKPWMVVVDEAHCVVQWGESFRPAYQEIAAFLKELPVRPVLCALTATADEKMQREIRSALGMRRPKRILLPMIRPNIIYDVRTTLDRTGEICRILSESDGRTVIFCRSRVRTEQLSALLNNRGHKAEYYHAGMARNERIVAQDRFLGGQTKVLCATTAFGLGVDIPDIRVVIHDHLPDSLIDYVQQSGRAGRDGADARCIVLIEPNELVSKMNIANRARETMRHQPIRRWWYQRRKYRELHQLMTVLMAADCIPAGAASAFGKGNKPCGRCSACKKGRLVNRVPSFAEMKEWQIRAWILMWQRAALAQRLACRPCDVMPDSAISMAARRFVFPQGAAYHPELERLLAHFRRETRNNEGPGRV